MMKHKLLRDDILPAMASNRKVQRLLNEFMDLLSEYENVEIMTEQKTQTAPARARSPQVSVDPSINSSIQLAATDQVDHASASTERVEIVSAETGQKDSSQLPTQPPAEE